MSSSSGKLWTAPEILRNPNPPAEGTQKADVYSFAVIVHEIIYRMGAFYVKDESLSAQREYPGAGTGVAGG